MIKTHGSNNNLLNAIHFGADTDNICFTRDNASIDHLHVSYTAEVTKLIARFLISLALLPPASGKQMRKPTC